MPHDAQHLTPSGVSTLAQMRETLPSDVFVQQPRRAWFGLARALTTVGVGELGLALLHLEPGPQLLWQAPALTGLWLLVASGMMGLFILGHDCGHGAFSLDKRVNVVVGHLCMSPLLTGFYNWRLSHAQHHARTQLRGEDTDWPEKLLTEDEYARAPLGKRLEARLAFGTPIGLLVGFVVGMVRRTFMATLYPQVKLSARSRRQLLLSNLCVALASGGVIAALALTLGPWGLAKHYFVPVYLGMVLGALFTFLHHSGEGARAFDREGWTPFRGQVEGTFDVRFPRWFEALFFHINRHLPHHVAPSLPWYHLPTATDALARAFPTLHRERRFSLGYLLRAWRAPLLSRESAGVYVASTSGERGADAG